MWRSCKTCTPVAGTHALVSSLETTAELDRLVAFSRRPESLTRGALFVTEAVFLSRQNWGCTTGLLCGDVPVENAYEQLSRHDNRLLVCKTCLHCERSVYFGPETWCQLKPQYGLSKRRGTKDPSIYSDEQRPTRIRPFVTAHSTYAYLCQHRHRSSITIGFGYYFIIISYYFLRDFVV